jgi:EAL domain-containing protein (putative c-di-GMP-specific phosphodiesterase class I)
MEGLTALSRRLRHALADGTLALRYQPVVTLATGTVDELRAVLRWPGEEIAPEQVIDIARCAGMLDTLHRWILRTACTEAVQWRADGVGASVGLTLGVDEVVSGAAANDVAAALAWSGLPAEALCIGIPISAVTAHPYDAPRTLPGLHALGVDVGLVGITTWPLPDAVRPPSTAWVGLDQTLIALLAELPTPDVAVDTVAAFVGEGRLRTVAMGVETDRELDCIGALGVTHALGYRFAPPTAARDLAPLLIRMGAAGVAKIGPFRSWPDLGTGL